MAPPQDLGERVAALEATLKAHSEEDSRRFDELNDKTDEVRLDVKTLLLRSLPRRKATWRIIVGAVVALATAVGGLFAATK